MEIKYIDIHSHFNLSPLKEKKEEVIAQMIEKGVATIVIGVDYETSKEAIQLAERYDFIWAGVGLHPTDNDKEIFDFKKYAELAKHQKVVCIGECGLDYFRNQREETKQKQKETFQKQVELAVSLKKPLMIHARPSKGSMDAYEDALDILVHYAALKGTPPQQGWETLRANFHFFVGNIEISKRALDMGFTMSFDGPITFSRDYDEVIKFLPIDSIMCETDAPFAAPAPHRGKTCEPWMVEEVYKKISEIKEMDFEEARLTINKNVKRFFNIN